MSRPLPGGRGAGPVDALAPFVQAELRLRWRGRSLALLSAHSLFSSARIDQGTRLLLDNLPPGEPETFLDLGCGYGALGLAIAAAYPRSRGLLVDRDLLAVEFARRNAALLGIRSVEVLASLGYGAVPPAAPPFDWILCNLPARAGERVLGAFLRGGIARLAPGGELRLVVIEPLAGAVERTAAACGLEGRRVAAGRGHGVHAFGWVPGIETRPESEETYDRDEIEVAVPGPLRLVRPTDLADEPHRLSSAVPLLIESLPAEPPRRALVFRCGYGLLPAALLARYPEVVVAAQDRDLLAAALTRRNCAAGAAAGRLHLVEALRIAAASSFGPFDLVLGELSPPLGPAATLSELSEARETLAPGSLLLAAGLLKQWREFLEPAADGLGLRLRAKRGPAALIEMRPA